MSRRIAKVDVEAALERYVRALKLAGLDRFSDVVLIHGSKVNGNSYKLQLKEGLLQAALGTDSGFIGWTRREARATLLSAARSFEDMALWATEEN